MAIKPSARRFTAFRRLQWRLTLNYTLVTVAALLTAGVLVLVILPFGLNLPNLVTLLAQSSLKAWASLPAFQTALAKSPPDAAAIDRILAGAPLGIGAGQLQEADLSSNQSAGPQGGLVVVVDPELYIVTTLPKLAGGVPAGLRLDETVAPFLSSLASQALTSDKVLDETSPNHISYAIPVIDKSGELYGAVILSIDPAQLSRQALSTLLLTAGGILLVFTLLAGAVGTLFGFVAARGLTRRLNRLAQASAAWRKGDFSVVAADRSGDEISNLASDLNYMAAELKTLFNYRQELAAVEERSRIARDLHDSVKQQAFAVAAQVSAGRSLLHRDPQAAEARLQEAERLNDSLRQELGMLVRELHGGDVLAQGLPAGLRELAAGWERQQIFTVSCEIHGDPVLPSNAQLALYRVAQEALANATRHSRASQVQLTLNSYSDRVELEIADNGQGFDPQTAAHGLGLDSMRRRMSDLDGELRIESAPGQGTRVIATVRLSGESNG